MTNGKGVAARVSESLGNVLLDKVVSIVCGVAAAVLASVFIPLGQILFSLYAPLVGEVGFLTRYAEYCLAIVIGTAVVFVLLLLKRPPLAWALYGFLCAAALVTSGMMRLEMGLPSIVWVQFLLYFAGIVIACEMGIAAFVNAARRTVALLKRK